MADESKIREELRKRNTAQATGRISGRHDPKNGVIDVINQIDAVPEEHIYLISKTQNGDEMLWEADLLGDRSPDQGHGRLVAMIHLFCPFCSTPEDPRAISIDYMNKRFELERLRVPEELPNVARLDGTNGPFTLTHHLHVAEPLGCPYYEDVEGSICGIRFTIRGSRIQRVG